MNRKEIKALRGIIETEIDKLPETLTELSPKERVEMLCKLLPLLNKAEKENVLGW